MDLKFTCIRTIDDAHRAVAFSPNGSHVVASCDHHFIGIWDIVTGKRLHLLTGHKLGILSLSYSPDGKMIASVSYDQTARLWNSSNGTLIRILEDEAEVISSFITYGRPSIFGEISFAFRPWSKPEADKDFELAKKFKDTALDRGWRSSVAFSPDGKMIVSGRDDITVRVWFVNTGKELHVLLAHHGYSPTAQFSPDGQIIVTGSYDRTLRLWDVGRGRSRRTLNGHTASIYTVAFSPDGKIIASGAQDGTVRLWNTVDGKPIRVLGSFSCLVYSVAFSPDGSMLAVGIGDNTAKIFDVVTGNEFCTLDHTSPVYSVAFSLDGSLLATAAVEGVKIWNVPNSLIEYRPGIICPEDFKAF